MSGFHCEEGGLGLGLGFGDKALGVRLDDAGTCGGPAGTFPTKIVRRSLSWFRVSGFV